MIGWKAINVDGKPAHFVDIEDKRLYIVQRNDEAFSAFVNGERVGLHYETLSAAQAAALTEIGVRPPPDPFRYSATQPKAPVPRPRIEKREELLKQHPIADLSEPPAVLEADGTTITFLPAPSAGSFELSVGVNLATAGHCACGARLGRSGKCPALCTPIERDPPPYSGPRLVGRTHTSRLGAPVSW